MADRVPFLPIRIVVMAMASLAACVSDAALACPPPPPIPEPPAPPPIVRLPGESDAEMTQRAAAILARHVAEQEAARAEQARHQAEVQAQYDAREAARQEALFDAAPIVLLARTAHIGAYTGSDYLRVRYRTERTLKGRAAIRTLSYSAFALEYTSCGGSDPGLYNREKGRFLIFLNDRNATIIKTEQLFPVDFVRSPRLRALIDAAPVP